MYHSFIEMDQGHYVP